MQGKTYESPISEREIKEISDLNVLFGHKSVGLNILDGIKDLTGGNINIREVSEMRGSDEPGLYHWDIGENYKPYEKIDNFSSFLTSAGDDAPGIAFMKLCYVDISGQSDVQMLFDHYRNTMTKLMNDYPRTEIIHLTIPLTERKKNLKSIAKRILGKPAPGFEDNVKREEYNELIRSHFENVFDLAALESTFPDGSRLSHKEGDSTYYSLVPQYTDDGEHLNQLGRRLVARALLKYIASLKQE